MEAEMAFRDAISADPGASEAHAWLGWALRELKQNTEAEKAFRDAISLDPASLDGHKGLGAVLWDSNRYAEAEVAFREAVRIDPSDAWTHRNLGRPLCSVNRFSEADAEFRVAVSLDPGNVDAQQDLAEMERDIDALEEAWYHRLTPFERWEKARRDKPDAETLLRCPHARAGRRFLAGFIDNCMILASPIFALAYGYWGLAFPIALYAFNGAVPT